MHSPDQPSCQDWRPQRVVLLLAALLLPALGCQKTQLTTSFDRPFPLGAVSDVFWETQQTNAEAADFIFFDHEFKGQTSELAPGTKRHLESVALRMQHVPFPVVIEQSPHNRRLALDEARRQMIVGQLVRMGVSDVEGRVVIAPAFVDAVSAIEGEQAYYSLFNGNVSGFNQNVGGGGGAGGDLPDSSVNFRPTPGS
ncbi:MAG: hypothetical protein CMJ81_09320 [Planctomycetaceae bacterium]|nr:hypothetical protein [Planctomycetaceae bacterium]